MPRAATRPQLVSQAWRPLLRGVYADAAMEHTHAINIAAARLLIGEARGDRRP